MTRLRTRSLLAALLLATAVFGACGSDEGDSTTLGNDAPAGDRATGDDKDTTGGEGSGDTKGDDHSDAGDAGSAEPAATVKLQGVSFLPSKVEVKVGDTVLWTWADSALHNVTGGPLKSGNKSGGEYKHTFDEAGEVEYECTIHPGMEGTVVVS